MVRSKGYAVEDTAILRLSILAETGIGKGRVLRVGLPGENPEPLAIGVQFGSKPGYPLLGTATGAIDRWLFGWRFRSIAPIAPIAPIAALRRRELKRRARMPESASPLGHESRATQFAGLTP